MSDDTHWGLLMSEQAGQATGPEQEACRECEGPLHEYYDQWVTDAKGGGYICEKCDEQEDKLAANDRLG